MCSCFTPKGTWSKFSRRGCCVAADPSADFATTIDNVATTSRCKQVSTGLQFTLNRSKCMRAVRTAGCRSSLLPGLRNDIALIVSLSRGLGRTRCDCNPCHSSPNTARIIRLRCCILISSTIAFAAMFIRPDLRQHQLQQRQRRVHAAHVYSC